MVNESVLMQQEIWQKQREAEERVRRAREENRRVAQQMAVPPPKECAPPTPAPREVGRWLPLVLALIILKEGGPTLLVLALLYLAL